MSRSLAFVIKCFRTQQPVYIRTVSNPEKQDIAEIHDDLVDSYESLNEECGGCPDDCELRIAAMASIAQLREALNVPPELPDEN